MKQKLKRKSNLGGLSTNYFIAFLRTLDEPRNFTELYMKSHIYHKKSFLKYLHWLEERNLILKFSRNHEQRVIYHRTKIGTDFLELLE